MPKHVLSSHTARLIAVIALILLIFIRYGYFRPAMAKPKVEDRTVIMPYRTIAVPGEADSLFAYELHRRAVPQECMAEYCAIIRNIDPAKDDYKSYCRSVIEDVVRSIASKKIIVYIYDSNEAYHLYETKYLQQMEMLTDSELKEVAGHRIATYFGEALRGEYENNYLLSYYEDASNGLAAVETYNP